MTALLDVAGLTAYYGRTKALHGIDFAVQDGGVTAILGANGAGKTTALRAVCRMIRTAGSIRVAGQTVERLSTEDVARLGVAHVPSGRGTFVALTVEENLRLGGYTRGDRVGVARDLDRVFGYFPRLKERLHQQAGTLSGGEQQMLAVSRALMLRPRLLLLDEPSFGLAPRLVSELFAILSTIHQQERVSMLLVEQNANLALELADEAYLLETGRIVFAGPAAAIKANEAVRRSYLGY